MKPGSGRSGDGPGQSALRRAERWYRLLLRLYPREFRRAMGPAMVEAFRDQCRAAYRRSGVSALLGLCLRAVFETFRNAMAERMRPAVRMRPSRGSWRPIPRPPPVPAPRRERTMERIRHELRAAARLFGRAPGFALAVVATLAVGVAAFASIFAVVDGVLLEPLPYEEPEELVYVWRDYTWFDLSRGWMGGVDVLALRERGTAFQGVTALRSGRFNLSGRDSGEPREIRAILASDNFLDVLGVEPLLGRGFRPGEDDLDAANVVILGHALWQQRYGGDPEIVGREIWIDDAPVEVIGVMGPGFDFAMHSSLGSPSTADVYTTLQMDLSQVVGGSMAAVARLEEGVTPQRLQAELDAIVEPIDREYFDGLGLRLWAVGMREDLIEGVEPALWAVLGAALLVLLVLGVNLATLMLGRGARRGREMAVRAALGAGKLALARQWVLESTFLAVAGGIVGILLATRGTDLLLALAPEELPRQSDVAVDASVVAAALALSALLGVAASLGAVVRTARGDLATGLREAAIRGDAGTAGRGRRTLVVAQVALSLMLLAGAGVLTRSFVDLLSADPGFDPRGALTFRVPLSDQQYPAPAAVLGFFGELRRDLRALPGVEAVGAGSSLPLTEETSQNGVAFPGAPGNRGAEGDTPLVDVFSVTPGYFTALSTPILAGRGFTEGDDSEAPLVAVIDDTLATRFFPNDDAPGHTLEIFDEERLIVGVVDQPRLYDVHADDRGQVYVPHAQEPGGPDESLAFVLRTGRDPASMVPEVRRVVREIDADQPVADVRPLQALVDASLAEERLSLSLIAGFALAALLLAALGLYGVISQAVTDRMRELGVRMALGADPGRVRRLVLRQGAVLTLAGLTLGLLGALWTTRLLESLLVGVDPVDPTSLATVSAGLALVTFVATWIPARRATRIDPLVALRSE